MQDFFPSCSFSFHLKCHEKYIVCLMIQLYWNITRYCSVATPLPSRCRLTLFSLKSSCMRSSSGEMQGLCVLYASAGASWGRGVQVQHRQLFGSLELDSLLFLNLDVSRIARSHFSYRSSHQRNLEGYALQRISWWENVICVCHECVVIADEGWCPSVLVGWGLSIMGWSLSVLVGQGRRLVAGWSVAAAEHRPLDGRNAVRVGLRLLLPIPVCMGSLIDCGCLCI